MASSNPMVQAIYTQGCINACNLPDVLSGKLSPEKAIAWLRNMLALAQLAGTTWEGEFGRTAGNTAGNTASRGNATSRRQLTGAGPR